jgi:hypothetical protein
MKARKELILAGTVIVILLAAVLGSILLFTNDNPGDRNAGSGLQDVNNNGNIEPLDEVPEVVEGIPEDNDELPEIEDEIPIVDINEEAPVDDEDDTVPEMEPSDEDEVIDPVDDQIVPEKIAPEEGGDPEVIAEESDIIEEEEALSEEEIVDEEEPGLSEQEIEGLIFMREEEKLARDVYAYLFDIWGHNTFGNIQDSEQKHMDSIKVLLDQFSLEDPVGDNDYGEFENQNLLDLYNDLIESGEASLVDALMVGAAIEEIDIIDIQEYIDLTDDPDIIRVYENLIKGSENHLNAFVNALSKQGIEYEPQYLSQEEYDRIVW